MGYWERELFEKEYADINWYKGKQAKCTANFCQLSEDFQNHSANLSVLGVYMRGSPGIISLLKQLVSCSSFVNCKSAISQFAYGAKVADVMLICVPVLPRVGCVVLKSRSKLS